MKSLLQEIWASDRRGFLRILGLNIVAALLSGVGIVMLIPLLRLIGINESGSDLFTRLSAPLQAFPYAVQVIIVLSAYILLVLLKAIVGRVLTLRSAEFTEGTTYRLRQKLYAAVSGASWEQLAGRKHADLINLFVSQCNQVTGGIEGIIGLLTSFVSAAIQFGIALWMNAPMTVAICILGGGMLAVFLPLRKKSRAYGDELIKMYRDFYAELDNQLSSIKEIRAYGAEDDHAKRFDRISNAFRDAHQRYVRMSSVPSLVYSVAAACIIAGAYLLSTLVLHVEVDRLVVLVYIFARLWPVFSGLQGRFQSIYSCIPAYEKLNAAVREMQANPEMQDADDADISFDGWNTIRFEDVSFAYHDAEECLLKHMSFTVQRGYTTALVGHNGTGKTTTVNLLLGFLKPTSGVISVDDTVIAPENLRAWRRQVGYIPQDPILLNASVRENLTRFHPDATDEEVLAALKKAMAFDFVSKLPEGLDTLLGERGIRLSGGERQRIVLARVLMGKPQLIVFDEATSALDYESETAFRQVIRSLEKETAVILIAHRLSSIRMAQKAIVLDNGTVAEQGDMDELLHNPNSYLAGMVEMD